MRTLIAGSLAVLLMSAVLAQQPPTAAKQEKATWRTVGAVAGAGGGYALGLAIGLVKFDDAINSDRKVWTAAIVGAVAGGVGGYFAGRAIDKHNAVVWKLDPMDRSLLHAQHGELGGFRSGEPTPARLADQ